MENPEATKTLRATQEASGQDIAVTLYTDPLCCWSWVFQPVLAQLKTWLHTRARWQLRMGGLLPDWSNFTDDVNSVSRPAQMGPVWMHAGQIAGRTIKHQIWHLDPPSSSYPSCIAVKCAQLQSQAAGFEMLQALQQACMEEGKNIAKKTVLLSVAEKVAAANAGFDLTRFKDDFQHGHGAAEFRKDLDAVHAERITRFPSMIVRANGKAILISGYKDFSAIATALKTLVPDLIADETMHD